MEAYAKNNIHLNLDHYLSQSLTMKILFNKLKLG